MSKTLILHNFANTVEEVPVLGRDFVQEQEGGDAWYYCHRYLKLWSEGATRILPRYERQLFLVMW
jgi:hypothetical protein